MGKLTKFKNNLTRGDTPVIQFPLTVNGAVANLTGYFATFTITASATGGNPIIQIAATGDATGTVSFQLKNGQALNDTSALVPDTTYYWDLQLSNELAGTSLRIFTPLRGTLGVDTDFNTGIA